MAKTYSPKQFRVIVGGQLITGYADGTFISASRNADAFQEKVGADGEVARMASSDESGTIELTLLQTSAGNDILSNFLANDELTQLGTFGIMLKDQNGRTVIEAPEAWIKKVANAEFGNEVGTRVWTIFAANLRQYVGGN